MVNPTTIPYPIFKNSTQTGYYQFEFYKKYKQLLKNLQSAIKTEDFSEIKRAYLKLERFIEFTC